MVDFSEKDVKQIVLSYKSIQTSYTAKLTLVNNCLYKKKKKSEQVVKNIMSY